MNREKIEIPWNQRYCTPDDIENLKPGDRVLLPLLRVVNERGSARSAIAATWGELLNPIDGKSKPLIKILGPNPLKVVGDRRLQGRYLGEQQVEVGQEYELPISSKERLVGYFRMPIN